MLTHTILVEVDWQADRGHTVESLLVALIGMRLVDLPQGPKLRLYTYGRALVHICSMISANALEIDGTGRLHIVETPDPLVEMYRGSWYVTKQKTIRGPLEKEEAVKCLA